MSSPNPSSESSPNKALGLLALLFVGMAIFFALTSTDGSGIPIAEREKVSAEDLSIEPRFKLMGDDAVSKIEGFQRNCMDCHELIDSEPRSSGLMQHEDIVMNHGMNGRCVNCHDEKDRDMLTLRDGTQVGFSQSTMLCAQCHGTTYRRWQRGAHGKTIGYWDANLGTPKKLLCLNCHDPHSPHFEPMKPLPGPNTLRMGEQSHSGQQSAGGQQSPLSRYRPSHQSEDETLATPTQEQK